MDALRYLTRFWCSDTHDNSEGSSGTGGRWRFLGVSLILNRRPGTVASVLLIAGFLCLLLSPSITFSKYSGCFRRLNGGSRTVLGTISIS
jgi:hypothetical protein